MHRNTLLNDFDDRRFVSQTCFYCQYYCISLRVQLVTSADIGAGHQKYFTRSTLIAYVFHHEIILQKVIKGSNK